MKTKNPQRRASTGTFEIRRDGDVLVDGKFVARDAMLYREFKRVLLSAFPEQRTKKRTPGYIAMEGISFFSNNSCGDVVLEMKMGGPFMIGGKPVVHEREVYVAFRTWLLMVLPAFEKYGAKAIYSSTNAVPMPPQHEKR